jgi:MoaA/NifB/PqqE/SkfB family radical SAM enzyme
MDALDLVKSLGMACFVTTNMTAVTDKRATQMVEMGLDRLYVSLWASTSETYMATHPNASEKTFPKIDRRLRQFHDLKSHRRQTRPEIIIHNVIFNKNYQEVRKMVNYAIEVGASAVQFTMIYALLGTTDVLLMDQAMQDDVLAQLDAIPVDIRRRPGLHGPGTFIYEQGIIRERLQGAKAGIGSYDNSLIDQLPCQIGWFYSSIRTNGDVIPCCKGLRRPMGNLHTKPFREIWCSETYSEFREKAKSLPKSDPYFAPINCYKMCDNIGMLRLIEHKMRKLRPLESFTKRAAVPLVRAALGRKKTHGEPTE